METPLSWFIESPVPASQRSALAQSQIPAQGGHQGPSAAVPVQTPTQLHGEPLAALGMTHRMSHLP